MGLVHGEKWKTMSDTAKIAHLESLCAGQNEGLDLMQKERNALLIDVKRLGVTVENAEAAFYGQKTIVKQLINQKVEVDRDYQKRIEELISQVRSLGGSIN